MLQNITVKTILNKTQKRDPWFLDDYTINPYSGCSFNCLYCYIRGSKYGVNMEQRLSVKSNALELLEKQLALKAKKNQYGIIILSSATDPYLQFEKEYLMTRKILELILKYKFPVHIITKSDMVIRDFDLLYEINENAVLPDDLKHSLTQKVFITFSFSSIDNKTARIFEPGATLPEKRLEALQSTIDSGFLSGVSLMPLLPYISDVDEVLEEMFSKFVSIGTKYIFPAGLSLYGEGEYGNKTMILKVIQKHYPDLFEKYIRLFNNRQYYSEYYNNFNKRINFLHNKYQIRNRIL